MKEFSENEIHKFDEVIKNTHQKAYNEKDVIENVDNLIFVHECEKEFHELINAYLKLEKKKNELEASFESLDSYYKEMEKEVIVKEFRDSVEYSEQIKTLKILMRSVVSNLASIEKTYDEVINNITETDKMLHELDIEIINVKKLIPTTIQATN